MKKTDIAEIKRRLKKDKTTITKLAGCYVNGGKEKVIKFTEDFLMLEEDEFYKYLEIAGKVLSGTPKNNLIELSFPDDEELSGGAMTSLLALRDSGLENPGILDAFYDLVIDNYDTVDNYLILLYYDSYDIPMKGTDMLTQDESDEIYTYIMCALCPVKRSKPALGYREDENIIAARIRDWVVGAPDSGFTFPAFSDRSQDIHHILAYTRDAKKPHREFWENALGCPSKYTSTEKRMAFSDMITKAVGDTDETADMIIDVQQNIHDYIESEEAKYPEAEEPVVLSKKDVEELLEDSGISERKALKISDDYESTFADERPDAGELVDKRLLKNNEIRAEKKALQEKVVDLSELLKEAGAITEEGEIIDVVLKVSERKAPEVFSRFIDGRRCLVVPMDSDDTASVNGERVTV